MRRRLTFLALLFSLAACDSGLRACSATTDRQATSAAPESPEARSAHAIPGKPTPVAGARVVAFFGDSLTAGYHLPKEQAFPAKIEKKIEAEGLPYRVVNAGVSGDTTADGLKRVDWVLRSHPRVVFLCLGANDGLRGLDAGAMERNLRAIIDRLGGAGARVVLGGMMLPLNYGPSTRERFAQVFPRLAAERHLALVPFLLEGVALDPELTIEDNTHPNDKGTSVMAETIWKTLRPVLEDDARRP